MQAIRVHGGNELRYEDVPDPQPDTGEVVVELRAAGVNRRDLLVRNGTYPFPLPLVPGSDGAGVRTDTGEEVVVFPALGWGDREDAPAPGFGILGGPRDGTYAELVALPVENTQLGSPRDFEHLLRMLEGASWKPVLDSVRPLAEAEAALACLESGEHYGKLVLEIAQSSFTATGCPGRAGDHVRGPRRAPAPAPAAGGARARLDALAPGPA